MIETRSSFISGIRNDLPRMEPGRDVRPDMQERGADGLNWNLVGVPEERREEIARLVVE